MVDARLAKVQESLLALEKTRDLASAKQVVRDVSALLVPSLSEDVDSLFRLLNDQEGKLKANAGWFFSDSTITDKLATYTLETPAESNLDIKVFGVKKAKKGTISWAVGLTPNFEDEPFNGKFNVGIDFIIPESLDRVIVALSKNYVIRTLELKGQLTATFQEILNSWMSVTDLSRKVEFHEILWNSLDLSPINKKFYEGISKRFISLRQHIETSGALDHEHAAQFANRLIGRVIFTWFLDKKSLIEPSLKYFESEDYKDDTDYYRDKLESLFFEVLNTPVSDRSVADTSTPYLNGGLFEPKPGDLYKDKTLTFPKNFFDDFLGFLRGYNFTTDESTTEFQQVAIDPEMLGRIFENLLAEVSEDTGEQARKAKGAFYTPREIVDFMCRRALKSYLIQKLDSFKIPVDNINNLIDAKERDFQDQDHNWRRDWKPYKDKVLEALNSLRVVDPACGSGAFPMGMMQVLLKVYSRLETNLDIQMTKLSIIERNLFGVDIEPMAVEISRLRAWLALIVDEDQAAHNVKALPNLDFKFVCADSLIKLETNLSLFYDPSIRDALSVIRGKYYSATSESEKCQLKSQYQERLALVDTSEGDSRTSQLLSYNPFSYEHPASFFDSEEMFGFADGFDIAIGNPPYVSHDRIKTPPTHLRNYKVYGPFADLYCYFFELGFELVKGRSGILSYITSNSFIKSDYGKPLREYIHGRACLDTVINVEDSQLFETATVNTAITFLSTKAPLFVRVVNDSYSQKFSSFDDFVSSTEFTLPAGKLSQRAWVLNVGPAAEALDVISNAGESLKKLNTFIRLGIATGFNDAFVLDRAGRDALVALDAKNSDLIKPVIGGEDIQAYRYTSSKYILLVSNGVDVPNDYPSLMPHFESFGSKFRDRGAKGSHWTNLRPCAFLDQFKEEKIVWIELTNKGRFAYSNEEIYLLNSALFLKPPHGYSAKALTGLLNSSLINFYFKQVSQTSGMGTNRWIKSTMEELPIPPNNKEYQKFWVQLEALVEQILQVDPGDLSVPKVSRRIDEHVVQMYGMDPALAESVGIL